VFALPESAPIAKAAALMAFESIHRLPILDDGGAVVGLLSPLDVAGWLATRAGYLR
jgi:CBS-domain-containing membrane protein